MHYGLLFELGGGQDFKFDKHWHYDFNATKCPPWDLSNPKRRQHGLFEHPPRFTALNNKVSRTFHPSAIETKCHESSLILTNHVSALQHLKNQEHFTEYYRDVLAIETAATINAALCDFHIRNCPPSEQLLKECKMVGWIWHAELLGDRSPALLSD